MNLTLDDFDYDLPPRLIAQTPLPERAASRLLVAAGAALDDRHFVDLPDLLAPGDLLVMNDTRVLHARLYGRKDSGGQVEVLVERLVGEDAALAQVRASKPPKPGSHLVLEDALEVEVLGREGEFCRPTSTAPRPMPTKRATRLSSPAAKARWRRRLPACISTKRCSRNWPNAAYRRRR
jgi:S-adenosylmethionine:tRNA ribosyltransferase-isomerase